MNEPNYCSETLRDLVTFQLPNIDFSVKLKYSDLIRLSPKLSVSPFRHQCSLWTAYVCKSIPRSKNVVFFFNRKKQDIRRIIYANFVGELTARNYIKMECGNRECMCIHHMRKGTYRTSTPKRGPLSKTKSLSPPQYDIEF